MAINWYRISLGFTGNIPEWIEWFGPQFTEKQMSHPHITTIDQLTSATAVIRQHLSEVPLIRSYALEQVLGQACGQDSGFGSRRRVWFKDYGWTPVGSFKVMGALQWMHTHAERIGNRPVVAHSSGNFASGLSYAGMRYGKKVIVVMPDTAPQIKVRLTKSFGAEIRTYDLANDHKTGIRDRMVEQIIAAEDGVPAHPYDDPAVIAGNGVGGIEITEALCGQGRTLSHFFCAVSGGGLMSGHAIALRHAFPDACLVGVEPEGANDFQLSMLAGEKVRIDRPSSICDGLLSYDVGQHNWPILSTLLSRAVSASDLETQRAMRWLYQTHGVRSEPSGAITLAALLKQPKEELRGDGDIVVVISGRNVDDQLFADAFKEHTFRNTLSMLPDIIL